MGEAGPGRQKLVRIHRKGKEGGQGKVTRTIWPAHKFKQGSHHIESLNFKVGGMSLSSFPEVVADTEEEGTAESEEEIEKVRCLLS